VRKAERGWTAQADFIQEGAEMHLLANALGAIYYALQIAVAVRKIKSERQK